MAPKILVVLTSVDKIPSINKPTGWFLSEFSHPYDVLAEKAEIVVASPKGGEAPLDPGSIEFSKDDAAATAFFTDKKALWQNTQPISTFLGRADEFAALLYPGGHGPMFDLATDKDSIQLIQQFYAAGKPVAAVCHGPAAFVNVEVDGKPLLQGREVTGFSNDEEDTAQLTAAMPFLLEDAIKKAGATYVKAPEQFAAKVTSDGKVITGQNPSSAKPLGEAILKALNL